MNKSLKQLTNSKKVLKIVTSVDTTYKFYISFLNDRPIYISRAIWKIYTFQTEMTDWRQYQLQNCGFSKLIFVWYFNVLDVCFLRIYSIYLSFFFDKLRDRKFQFQFQMLIKKPPHNKTHSKIVINEFVFSKKKSVANKFNPNGVNNPLKISLERKNAKRNEIIINLQKFKKKLIPKKAEKKNLLIN